MTLEAAKVKTYSELFELPTAEAVRRLDAGKVPLHQGDAFLAVLVLRGVDDLRRSAQALDKARERLDRFGIALAVVATAAAVVSVLQAF